LLKKVADEKAELAKERAVVAGGTRPEKPGRIRQLRRSIARMLTIINEKEKGIGKSGKGAAGHAGKEKKIHEKAGKEAVHLEKKTDVKKLPAKQAGKEKR